MNKNIKRLIAMTLTIGAFSAVGQTSYGNFIVEANASTLADYQLTNLRLITSSGDKLNLYEDSNYNNKLASHLEAGQTYYAKTSSDDIVIESVKGVDKDYVRIFKDASETAYKVDDDINIESDTTTVLNIRIYAEKYDKDKTYTSSDYNQYTIEVENVKDENNIHLLSLELSDGDINFDKDDTSYKTQVALGTTSITVQAVPEDEDYKVEIDGVVVDKNGDYKQTITLNDDKTIIKVKVSDTNNNTKTYTLEVVKSDDEEDGNGLHLGWRNKNKNGNNGLHLGWRNENNKWHYLDNNGEKKKGWFKDFDESWYFLDNDGNMKIGWFKDSDSNWYYLNSNGKMKTSWLKDVDGNWYYLFSSGKMAKDTIVDGYKLDSNGAWIKN